MAPALDSLPNELFEQVVQDLDLLDICSLRCGSRQLASKSTQTHFKSFFRKKHVYLDENSLTDFVQATQISKLCCRVEHLVLVGIVDAASFLEIDMSAELGEEVDESRHDEAPQDIPEAIGERRLPVGGSQKSKRALGLLSKALRNLSLSDNTKHRRLPQLSLETHVHNRDAYRYERGPFYSSNLQMSTVEHDDMAARNFRFVMESMAISGLIVKKLEICYSIKTLGSSDPKDIRQFGIYSIELIGVQARYPRRRACFASITSLSISACPPRPPRSCPGDQYDVRESPLSQEVATTFDIQTRNHTPGLAQLVEEAESPDLQYCGGCRGPIDTTRDNEHTQCLVKPAVASKIFPRLRHCRLHGLRCHPDDLLHFLQRIEPRRIALQSIYLEIGSWQHILEYITGPQTGIKSVQLSYLTEEANGWFVPIWFPEAPTPPYYIDDGEVGDSKLERRDEAVRRPIHYVFMEKMDYGITNDRALLIGAGCAYTMGCRVEGVCRCAICHGIAFSSTRVCGTACVRHGTDADALINCITLCLRSCGQLIVQQDSVS